jgi:hypothetical protein
MVFYLSERLGVSVTERVEFQVTRGNGSVFERG